jgi:hypothetical protein
MIRNKAHKRNHGCNNSRNFVHRQSDAWPPWIRTVASFKPLTVGTSVMVWTNRLGFDLRGEVGELVTILKNKKYHKYRVDFDGTTHDFDGIELEVVR